MLARTPKKTTIELIDEIVARLPPPTKPQWGDGIVLYPNRPDLKFRFRHLYHGGTPEIGK